METEGMNVMNWQPIETAPKDGTWVLLYSDREGSGPNISVRSYSKWNAGRQNETMEWCDHLRYVNKRVNYTHWASIDLDLQKWQQISSAPLDGSWVLVYNQKPDLNEESPVSVRQFRDFNDERKVKGKWGDHLNEFDPRHQYSHWMPLSEPPTKN